MSPIRQAAEAETYSADKIAKELGPGAEEIWKVIKGDHPRKAEELIRFRDVRSHLKWHLRNERMWVKTLMEQGMGKTEAEMQARHWTYEGMMEPEKDETTDEEAFQNLAPESMWGLAIEMSAAGIEPADLLAGPEKKAAALTKLAEYRKQQTAAAAMPTTM